ncbi:MAG: hypothetical protein Q9181_002354 [Wetmoreana brouardii]
MEDIGGHGIDTLTVASMEGSQADMGAYQMHIVVQPPRESRTGISLTPPVVISLRTRHNGVREVSDLEGIGSCWALVSIVSEDGRVTLAPPSTTLLSGTMVDSLHKVPKDESEQAIGQASFHDLSINQRGKFRLRISLMRMTIVDSGTSGAVNGVSTQAYVRNMGSVLTHVVHVNGNM